MPSQPGAFSSGAVCPSRGNLARAAAHRAAATNDIGGDCFIAKDAPRNDRRRFGRRGATAQWDTRNDRTQRILKNKCSPKGLTVALSYGILRSSVISALYPLVSINDSPSRLCSPTSCTQIRLKATEPPGKPTITQSSFLYRRHIFAHLTAWKPR